MAWVEIDGQEFRTENVLRCYQYDKGRVRIMWKERDDSMYLDGDAREINKIMREAEEAETARRRHERQEDFKLLAREIAAHVGDMLDARDAAAQAKPKKPLKIDP